MENTLPKYQPPEPPIKNTTIQVELFKVDYSGFDEFQKKLEKANSLITELKSLLSEITNAEMEIQLSSSNTLS